MNSLATLCSILLVAVAVPTGTAGSAVSDPAVGTSGAPEVTVNGTVRGPAVVHLLVEYLAETVEESVAIEADPGITICVKTPGSEDCLIEIYCEVGDSQTGGPPVKPSGRGYGVMVGNPQTVFGPYSGVAVLC